MSSLLGLFGSTFDCICGRTHAIEPAEIVYADSAVERVADVLERLAPARRVGLLADVRTYEVAGKDVARALRAANVAVTEVIAPDVTSDGPVCDDVAKAKLAAQFGEQDTLVSVGAGVITDLVKWMAFEADLPFLAFATAPSMNGYASPNIAAAIKGVKTLVNGRCARAILASPSIMRAAPPRLIAAGLGDVLAKSISSADWKMNQVLFGDFYCPRAVELIAEIEPLYLEHPERIRQRDPQAIDALFIALLLTGAGMAMAGSSFPASGAEHLVSHTLDMLSQLDDVPHDLHGRQVGVATVAAAALYERMLSIDAPGFPADPAAEIDEKFWGTMAREVAAAYGGKNERLEAARGALASPERWEDLRKALREMARPPQVIRHCLREAGAASTVQDIHCPPERFAQALAHAREMRSRFTVLDLAALLGIMPVEAEALVREWVMESA